MYRKNNIDRIDWRVFAANKNIFEIDLTFLKKRMDIFHRELIMFVFHPTRFKKYINIGYDIAADEYIS
jgi:hypothetical protein